MMRKRPQTCPTCHADYDRDFRSGMTYRDGFAALWSNDRGSSQWAQKGSGAVLRILQAMKRQLWLEHLETCGKRAPNARTRFDFGMED